MGISHVQKIYIYLLIQDATWRPHLDALRQHLLYIIKHSVCFWCIVLTVMIIEIHLNKSEINVQLQHKAWTHEPQWGQDSASVPFISINCSSFTRRRRTDLTFHLDMLKNCELTNEPSWSLHHKKVCSDRLWSLATEIHWFSMGPPGRWKRSIWARRMNLASWLLSAWTSGRGEWEARSTVSPRYIQLTPKAILYLPWSLITALSTNIKNRVERRSNHGEIHAYWEWVCFFAEGAKTDYNLVK